MDQHSIYSPSRLSRILLCPGSVQLGRKIPDKTSSYALEGTMLHEVTHESLVTGKTPLEIKPDLEDAQRNAVDDCLDYKNILEVAMGDSSYTLLIEQQVNLLRHGVPETYGIVDLVIHDHDKRHVHIIDWKFGQGVPVYATDNEQLLAYAAGYAEPEWIESHDFTLHVVQPRIDNITTWTITGIQLKAWIDEVLNPGVARAREPNAPLVPGKKQCRWCPAAAVCRARMENANEIAAEIFKTYADIKEDQALVDDETLAKILLKAAEWENYIASINAHAQERLMSSGQFPGFKLVNGRSSRSWAYPDEQVAEELESLGVDVEVMYPAKLASPAQIETANRALKKNERFKSLYSKSNGKATMVPETDPRPAISASSKAEVAFSDLLE